MLKVITNNQPRDLIYGHELTDKERADFDYYTDEQMLECMFFRYKGEVYDPSDFQIVPDLMLKEMKWWDGYMSDTFFSGILIKWAEDHERVIVGRLTVMYCVVRFHFKKEREVIKINLTLEEAQEHCHDPSTSNTAEGWFDGWTEQHENHVREFNDR